MTSRVGRRRRHKAHKARNRVRAWRRRWGYSDRAATWPTLLEAVHRLDPTWLKLDQVAELLGCPSFSGW